jgi:hypothetical protein
MVAACANHFASDSVLSMVVRGDAVRFVVLRRWLCHLLLFAFALRAVIPAGYMPDFSGASGSLLNIVICSADGSKTISVDGAGHPVQSQHQTAKFGHPCAFSGLAALGLPSQAVFSIIGPELHLATPAIVREFVRPPVRAGPAHGSRAPPYPI